MGVGEEMRPLPPTLFSRSHRDCASSARDPTTPQVDLPVLVLRKLSSHSSVVLMLVRGLPWAELASSKQRAQVSR
jgi:hypothetical protein